VKPVLRSHGLNIVEILFVHGDNHIRRAEILQAELPANVLNFYSVFACIPYGPRVRIVTSMVAGSSAGVGAEFIFHTGNPEMVEKDGFGKGRTANVAEANEEDFGFQF
jgi:hypothetical protein